jgi:cbb3-type cytochrome oxidase maturation protein
VRRCARTFATALIAAAMEILLLLIPLSVMLVLLIGAVFWWSVRSGQFDDLEGPGHRILADDDCINTHERVAEDPVNAPADLISVKHEAQPPK